MFKTRPCIRRTALLSDPEFNLPGRTSGLAIMAITYSQDVRKSMVLIPEWGKDESGTVLLWRQHDAHVMVVEDDPQGDMCGEA
jgi:hypothetical protein